MQIVMIMRAILVLGVLAVGIAPAQADALRDSTSLRFAPESASFFTTSLRLQEQWQRLTATKAYARLKELPLVKMALQQAATEWDESTDEPVVKLREFLQAPENQNLIKVACDAVSHEFFMYGDENLGRALGQLNEFNRQISSIQWKVIGNDKAKESELKQQVVDELLESLSDLQIPQFVLGFRTEMPDLVRKETARLTTLIQQVAADKDELKAAISEVNTDRAHLIVARFDGSQIPWDEIIEEDPDIADQIRQIRDKVKDRQLQLAVGLVDDYVVFLATPESDVMACFESNRLLIDSPTFQRVRSFADRKLVSIGYISDEFAREISNPKNDIEQLAPMADAVIPFLEIDDETETELRADVKKLIGDLQALVPTPGAVLSFSFLTDSGYEGYTENWAENLYLKTDEPLDILQHVGGNPIVVVARNAKPMDSKLALNWLDRMAHYVEKIVLKNELDDDQWDLYTQVRDTFVPLVKEHREVTEKHWDKAFTSGQSAFVIDAALDAKPMWHFLMPPSSKPLPMLEIAWVYPLTNRFELEQALEGYQQVGDNMLSAAKQLVQEHQEELQDVLDGPAQMLPALLQNAQMPKPLEREVEDGKIRYRPTLQQAGIDSAIAPNLGWNSTTFAVSLSPETTERLLKVKEITGQLRKAEGKKLAMATYVDVSRLVGFFRPWVAYGLDLAKKQAPSPEQIEEIAPQVDSILEVLQCYQRYYSITFAGENSLVTHFRSDFTDLN